MIKILKTIDSRIWVFLIALLVTFVFASLTHAQEDPEDLAKKYGISFPIAELGNCGSLAECRTYCEDPVNQSTCVDFAKQKGFYQEDRLSEKEQEILNVAKGELGCDSKAACMAFCSEQANYEKCSSFAQKHGLGGGHVNNPEEQRFLEKAKEVLGCDSPKACMDFCNNEENYEKCSEFAKTVGLRGGEHHVGPGGCTSEETCRAFCSDPANYQVCSGFSSSQGGKFTGPGGCDSEESCRTYCTNHEYECRSLGGPDSSAPPYNPQEMCSKTPNCQWINNSCQCGSYEGSGDYPHPSYYPNQSYYPTSSYDPGQQSYPSASYTPYTGGNYDPAAECSKNPGCSWTGSSCQCQSSGGSSGSSYTQPSTENYTPPPSPTVQGTSTNRGLLYILWDFLTN